MLIPSARFLLQRFQDYLVEPITSEWDRCKGVYEQAVSQGHSKAHAFYQAFAVGTYDVTGAMGIYQAVTGEDPVTLQKFSPSQRVFVGVMGAVQLGTIAVGGARLMTTLKGPCRTRNR